MTSNVPALQSRVLNAPMTPAELFRTLRSCDISQISPDQNHQYIQDAQRDVDLLENDMELLENHIRRLRTRQAVLKRDILQYGSLESPIRKLPVEVLRLIFRFTSKQSIFGIDREWMSTAFCLSSVCSRWREVSLNSPELWADVGFSIDEEKALKPVLISLNRSQDYPLTVHIAGEDEDGQKFQAFLAPLYQNCDRLYHLDFTGMSWEIIQGAMDPFSDTPLLHSVVCQGELAHDVLARLITNAPRLRNVNFGFSSCHEPESIAYFPCNTTRHLEVRYDGPPGLEGVLEALRRGSQLESTTLRWTESLDLDSDTSDSYQASDEPTEKARSSISFLSVEFSEPKGFFPLIGDLLRSTSLPLLQDLRICLSFPYYLDYKKGLKWFGAWPRDAFHSFLDRSDCTLTTLALEGMALSESEVIGLLKYTPFLHTFTLCELWATDRYREDVARGYSCAPKKPKLKYRVVTKSFLKKLEGSMVTADAFATAQHPLIPRLKTLKLGVQSHFVGDEVFVNFVKSRWQQADDDVGLNAEVERLRTVALHVVGRKLVEKVYEPLKRVDREGMMISVFGDGVRVI
ncbi:hypothetical protein AAF712_011729 [Marasmius tenuissimus]|uniref:F-box domain-containing protein n=1 Tax=Marasmius tenuissimus TaxID=585030 RepID=A0ABR2ZJD2_9AGAR